MHKHGIRHIKAQELWLARAEGVFFTHVLCMKAHHAAGRFDHKVCTL